MTTDNIWLVRTGPKVHVFDSRTDTGAWVEQGEQCEFTRMTARELVTSDPAGWAEVVQAVINVDGNNAPQEG